ncbi:MAG TPA: phosphatidylserine/phosphatidylglycerophosphate/cardiolipin synthase family protein [Propionibacteriaceae bacterium]|nr:phosphatidylserine/phosphatidylglycerophosphate/cardiolipin synthase family protein [Propionibacteriaceae bacterium]
MSRLEKARKVANTTAAVIVGAQVATAVALSATDLIGRRHRRPYRFPVAEARTVHCDEDEVTIYTFGGDLYVDMLSAIREATETIYFETFIWKGDDVGRRFRDALDDAAARGVKVHLVWDQFANLVVPPSFFRFHPAVKVKRHPWISSPFFWNPRNMGRDHRKILVVDSRIAFLGGYNIGRLYADHWRDTHARLVGPSVAEVENAFIDYWNASPVWLRPTRQPANGLESPERSWNPAIRVHRNSPRWAVYPIRNMYLEAIDKAAKNIWLTHAYLIPDDDLMAALFAAVKRGVDVRIIIPADSNHVVADWLSRGFYDDLLSYGVHLLLYQGAMVHAKTATIDGVWSTIGTANLDRLSLMGNYEVNVEFFSEEVAARMEEIFLLDASNTLEMSHEFWRTRSALAKATEGLLAPWRPLL